MLILFKCNSLPKIKVVFYVKLERGGETDYNSIDVCSIDYLDNKTVGTTK